jgi:capsular polysaccharide transport system ATP-binding protein
MIELNAVTKRYPTRTGMHTALNNIRFKVARGEKIGILGRNGAGKSTLIRIIGGSEPPTSGSIHRGMSVSWPIAFGGAFQGSLSGMDNLKFICRVYGVDFHDKLAFVEDFSELGKFLHEPIKNYSSGMRSKLAFAISMAIEFDCFLIDEAISVGDKRFADKCQRELFELRQDRALIMVSHEVPKIRKHCEKACVLKDGVLYDEFDTIDDAYKFYNAN